MRRRCLRRKERKNQAQQGRVTCTQSAGRQMHREPPRVGFPLFMMVYSFLTRPRDLNCSRYGSVTVLAVSACMFTVCVCGSLRLIACVTCAVDNWRESETDRERESAREREQERGRVSGGDLHVEGNRTAVNRAHLRYEHAQSHLNLTSEPGTEMFCRPHSLSTTPRSPSATWPSEVSEPER